MTQNEVEQYDEFVAEMKRQFAKFHGVEANHAFRSFYYNHEKGTNECSVTVCNNDRPDLLKFTSLFTLKEILL